MGGHHHVVPPKVPDPSIYKVEDSEVLMKVKNTLAEKGLKDPWLRNYVWREVQMNKHVPKNRINWIWRNIFFHGWKVWVPLVGLTIAVESFLDINYHGHPHEYEGGIKKKDHHH